jgi:hypothetical protein
LPAPLPADFGVAIDPATRVEAEGAVLLGGDPFAVVRLGEDHAAAVRAWRRGEPAGPEPGRGRLARALVATNLAQPVPPARDPGLTVTAVVPVRDRPEQLERLLTALAATAEVGEVVVVDDASEDPDRTARVAGRAGARLLRRATRGGAAGGSSPAARSAGGPALRRRSAATSGAGRRWTGGQRPRRSGRADGCRSCLEPPWSRVPPPSAPGSTLP